MINFKQKDTIRRELYYSIRINELTSIYQYINILKDQDKLDDLIYNYTISKNSSILEYLYDLKVPLLKTSSFLYLTALKYNSLLSLEWLKNKDVKFPLKNIKDISIKLINFKQEIINWIFNHIFTPFDIINALNDLIEDYNKKINFENENKINIKIALCVANKSLCEEFM